MAEQTSWYKRRWIALGFLALALLVISLDNTVLNLALPSISRGIWGQRLTGCSGLWMPTRWCSRPLLLTVGSIGDRFGRKKVLQAGLFVFGSVFPWGRLFPPAPGTLIAMRALMGIGGAAIMPSTLSIITATFRDNKERAQAIAVWAATFALGTGIGPLVGGWLLIHFAWSSVFYINLPVVVIGLVGGYFVYLRFKSGKPAQNRCSGMHPFADRFIRAGLRHYPGRYQRLDSKQRTLGVRRGGGFTGSFYILGTAHHPRDAAAFWSMVSNYE